MFPAYASGSRPRWLLLLFLAGLGSLSQAYAAAGRYRVMWGADPTTSVIIGWDQLSGAAPVLRYDSTSGGSAPPAYRFSATPYRIDQARGMHNHFVRLTGLRPNTNYYFMIQDDEGEGRRLFFRTAPDTPDVPLSIIAGGDSRNLREARRRANRMVSRIRPHFVLFAGDMTANDTNQEWQQWLDDWQLTISDDGRIYPIVPARGNHEASNRTITDVFDVADPEIQYALPFGGDLLRIYTLNSMMPAGGRQQAWLEDDLQRHQSVRWRIAQYHHAMRPHARHKSEKTLLQRFWAPLFYSYQVQLVVESDSHVVKWTYPIRPDNGPGSDEGFIRDEVQGTVYIGEGCWGAPLRPNDDDKDWTRASGSFNQFKLIYVNREGIEVRTIPTDQPVFGNARDDQPFILPAGLRIWDAPNGAVLYIPAPAARPETLAVADPGYGTADGWENLPTLHEDPDHVEVGVPLHLEQAGSVELVLLDTRKKIVAGRDIPHLPPGDSREILPLPGLAAGRYLLEVRYGDGTIDRFQVIKR